MLGFNLNMNEFATQSVYYPQIAYVMPTTLPQPVLDTKTLPLLDTKTFPTTQMPTQFPVMPMSMPGYTPCLVGDGYLQPLQQVPMMTMPTMPFLTPTASPQTTPNFQPLLAPVNPPPMNLDIYNLDADTGREDSDTESECDSSAESLVFHFEEVAEPVERVPETKEQIVPKKLAIIEQMFAGRYDEQGMRGSDIARIKVKTITALNNIVELLDYLACQMDIIHVSCPKSTKKGGASVRGFIAYLKVAQHDLEKLENLFGVFNMTHEGAFHPIDINPQKQQA
jgi:hypothetical protein